MLRRFGVFSPMYRALDSWTGSESGLTNSGMSGFARSLPYDLLGLLERHDALALVGFRMLALGILKQAHHLLTLLRRKVPRVPLETRPAGRLARANGPEVAGRLLVVRNTGRPGILLLRASTQDSRANDNQR
jgi:hypothetical protein